MQGKKGPKYENAFQLQVVFGSNPDLWPSRRYGFEQQLRVGWWRRNLWEQPLQLGVRMAVAEFERSIIQERVAAGLKAARARGAKLGRPTTFSQHQKAACDLLSAGKGVREIARELGLRPSSVAKLGQRAG